MPVEARTFKAHLLSDFSSSIVVFLIAIPLCLGVSLSSGVPLTAGIIAGVVGGIVVGSISGSVLGVSGPAVGLCLVVLDSLAILKGFDVFLLAVVVSGFIQVLLGAMSAGYLASYFPSCVVKGMLSGIGIVLVIKQIPYVIGYDHSPGYLLDMVDISASYIRFDLAQLFSAFKQGVLVISLSSICLYVFWESWVKPKFRYLALIPAPLLVIFLGIILSEYFEEIPHFSLMEQDLVSVPIASNFQEFLSNLTWPDFSSLINPQVYLCGLLIAVVASIETLLSVEAIDKQDPLQRKTPTNRELKAQGVGNIISGLLGGLPITQVIVRSSANCQSGAKSKLSTIFHGCFLLLSVASIPHLLNMIPLASLAIILCGIGLKLAAFPYIFSVHKMKYAQSFPFMATLLGVIFFGFLAGVIAGLLLALLFILKNNLHLPCQVVMHKNKTRIILAQNVSFLNKVAIQKTLDAVSHGSECEIDAQSTHFIHPDIEELFLSFIHYAENHHINLTFVGFNQRFNIE